MDENFLLAIINAILVAVNSALTAFLLFRGYAVSREIGAASIAASAQDAYEDLIDSRDEGRTPEQINRFYDRLWAAQALQFEQWRRHLIPDLIYLDWLIRRREQFLEDREIQGISFRESWRVRFENRYFESEFGKFMSDVFSNNDNEAETPRQTAAHVRASLKNFRRTI
jgi:hypothetical protein